MEIHHTMAKASVQNANKGLTNTMQTGKSIPLFLYGAIVILSGLLMVFLQHTAFDTVKLTLGIGLFIGAILAFVTALTYGKKQVQFAYHEMHAIALLAYAIAVLFFCNTFVTLNDYTAYLLFFYTFSEIIFCSWLFNLGKKVVYKILFIRIILAFATGIGIVVIMSDSTLAEHIILIGYGALFIVIGTNVLLYQPIVKGMTVNETWIQRK